MSHDPVKLLQDIADSAGFILGQTRELSLEAYERNRLVRDAVERNFIVIGEAFVRLTRTDATVARSLGDYPQIIAFRNVVVHGYDAIEDAIVWGIIENEMPRLLGAARKAIDG